MESLDHADLLIEIEQMRTEFVTTIAHELRTPLTAMRTSVGLLLDPAVEPSPDQRQVPLETIERNATRMQRVVSDIVDLTRFRAGRIQLQLRRFDAVAPARSAIASIAPLAESRAQAIGLEAPSEPVWVFGDYRRLEQTLVNLLSNAVKYSPDGSPIQVTVAMSGPDVTWTVTDKGHGIRAADQARLFERSSWRAVIGCMILLVAGCICRHEHRRSELGRVCSIGQLHQGTPGAAANGRHAVPDCAADP